MKAYTDLNQSRKLAEILPIESADMWYPSSEDGDEIECGFDATRHLLYVDYCEGLPCWSLGALLKILSDITDYSFELIFLKCTTAGRGDVLENTYRCSVDMKDTWNTEPLDAIFEMIVWLK